MKQRKRRQIPNSRKKRKPQKNPRKQKSRSSPLNWNPSRLPDTWIVGEGESVRFQNKIIHLSSPDVRCEGLF